MMDEGGAHRKLLRGFSWLVAMAVIVAVATMCFIAPVSAQPVGAPFDHFATGFPLTGTHASVPCASCHAPGVSQSTPRLCFDCHNGQKVSGKSVNHTLTSNRCVFCHQTTLWSDIRRIEHAEIPSVTPCAACHNSTIAIGKAATHVPTIAPCQMCHTSTASFAIGVKYDHTGITDGCATCHNGVGALGKPSNHVPTTLPCETCHTSTVTFANATYTHRPSDTNCVTCHNNVITTGQVTPPHIPTGAAQCSACHANTAPSFTAYTMNHPAVSGTRCDTCHNGSFTSQGNQGAYSTAQFANHVPTSGQDCATCHASAAASYISWAGGTFVHSGNDTNCSSCHNNLTALGNTTPPHIPVTGVQCSNCHTNTAASFTTYVMNHSSVSAVRCDACHNGSYTGEGSNGALGTASYLNHVATNGRDCVTCHASAASSFTSWAGAKYVHAASDTNCSSCHNNTLALGLTTPPHVPVTGVQCSSCHTNTATSFVTYTMNHASVSAARCDSCHNGSYLGEGTKGALGTASYAGHVATTGRDCITCHASAAAAFTSWAGAVYAHQPSDTNCSSCHNGTVATGNTTPPHIPVTGVQCSNCHTNTATSFVTYTMTHSAVSAARCDSCHNGSYTSEGTKGALGTASYAGHVATTGRDCLTCHASAATTFTSWAGAAYAHQPSDTNCVSCHNGTIATGNTTPPHIPMTGVQCSNCHTNTAASFVTYTMTHSAVSGSRCDSCHNGSYTSQGTKGAQGTASYPGHVVTGGRDCLTCHASAATTYTSWAGATYIHQATDTNCTNCHNGLVATGLATPPHIPTGVVQCSNCHTNTAASFVTYTMTHSAVTGTRCDSCHNGSYTGEGTKGAQGTAAYPGHVATSGRDCADCHASAATTYTSWAGGTFVHQPSDTNCSSCHNGTTATGLTMPPHVPVTGVQCSNCHTNTAASFVTYTMNHAAVNTARCDSCHNGSYTGEGTKGALGSASFPNHVATAGRDCVTCHASTGFLSWAGGIYVHQAGDTNCLGCHNGTTAPGMTTPPHIPTSSIQCSNCHNNTAVSFITYTMNHAAVSGTRCDSCHGGAYTAEGTKGAQGTASYAGHLPTNGQDCIACHAKAANGYTTWSGATYAHAASDTNCANCHNGTTATGNTTPPHIPVTGVQCSNCHTNTATSFATYTMTHSAVSAARCDSCHNGSYASQGTKGAQGTASFPNHIATNGKDCASCHASAAATFVSWVGGVYTHQPSDTNCSSCHNGTSATGNTTPPHIPVTGVQCSSCHTNTATSFLTYTMVHASVSAARCDSCHNGSYTGEGAKGALGTASYVNHVVTSGRDCVTCHASAASTFTSWAGGTYVHQPGDTICSTCHNGKIALGMTTPPHVPVTGVECGNCHTNTAASFISYTMVHASVSAARCDSCHNGAYLGEGTKGALGTASYPNHVTTNGWDCATCHASAAASFTSWAGGKYVHQTSDTNCSTCHNGTIALGMKTPPHIPSGAAQCSSCHTNTAASFTTYVMNHSSVSAVRCDACHNGSYTGEGSNGALGTASYLNHVATNGRDCVTCHASAASSFTSWAGAKYVHAASDTNCSSCHNNTLALGLTTPPHVPVTGVQCSSCHTNTATSFVTYTMNHASVSAARCDSCHNGSYLGEGTKGALGTASYAGHVATTGRDCITCHASAAAAFTSWAGAVYAHQPSDTNCSSCHNGTVATGNTTPPHIPVTGVQCSNCHTNTATSFVTYTMTHSAVSAARCDSCHNGSYTSEGTKGALGTASYAGHVATTGRDCLTCHASAATTFTSWAGGVYPHQPSDTNCVSCHNGTIATGNTTPPHIPVTGVQCSNCHTNTAASFVTYTMTHSAVSAARCDSCHNGSYTSQGTKGAQGTASYPGHVVTGGRDCLTCHASAATTYTSWAGGGYVHQASDTNCSSCHNGTTALGMTTPPHIPTGVVQCSNCHTNTAASFVTYTMTHSAVTGTRCDSCHNGAYTAEGTKGAQGTSAYPNHVATAGRDCVTCHASAASSYASWAGGTYVHQASDTNCSSCHNGTTALGMTTPPHVPVAGVQCSNCHTNTAASFVSYTMTHSAVSTARCNSCHNGSYTGEGTKGAQGTSAFPGHVATGGRDCITCHANSATSFTSWAGGGYVHLASDTNCSSCHNGTIALGLTTPPHVPVTGVQCSNCHSNASVNFLTYTMSHPAVSASRCDSCHNGSYTGEGSKGAYGTASYAGHVATGGRDCITCHASASPSFTSWAGGTYVHQVSDTNCSACHNGATATGMTTPPHIPSGAVQCSNCHTNTATSFTSYTMTHSAVSGSRCDSCHNGVFTNQGTKGAYGTASYSGHVPTSGQDCKVCHATAATNFTSWAGATYVHQPSDTNCVGCHNGTTATGNTTPPHIPTGTIQCSNCHTNTAASFTTYTMSHTAVTSIRCDACHNGSYKTQGTKGAQAKPNDHPKVTQDCGCCHTSTTSWGSRQSPGTCTTTAKHPLPGATVAAKVKSTLAATVRAVTAVVRNALGTSPPTKQPAAVATRAPVPRTATTVTAPSTAATTADPKKPGTAATPPTGPPNVPGFNLFGGPTLRGGNFTTIGPNSLEKNNGPTRPSHPITSSGCATCHNGRTAVGKPSNHLTTSAPCENCHRSTITFAGARVDHQTITAACSTCHTGTRAVGKPPQHIATTASCDTCHKSRHTFAGARLDHRSITAPCATCHNGTAAVGKPPRHVATTAPCETCHKSTNTFGGARLDHRAITAPCATCHNGTVAVGKPRRHIATTAPCESCHRSTIAFAGARMDHGGLTARCASCHNGATASGPGPRHFTTMLPCESCHRTTTWTFVLYRHASPLYPNHGMTVACAACHVTNAQAMVWKFPAYKPDCAACHADKFRPQPHAKVMKPIPVFYTVAELRDCTGACHVYTDRTMTTIETRRSHIHRANGGGW